MMTAPDKQRATTQRFSPGRTAFRLGPYRVEPDTGCVSSGKQVVQLEPRVMAVLAYLAARPGEVISKQTLKDEIWGTQHVVDEAVKRCITQIRKALKDDPRQPRIVATLPKRGYRLIAAVQRPSTVRPAGKLSRKRIYRAFATLLLAGLAIVILADSPISETKLPQALDIHQAARDQYLRYDREGIERAITLFEFLIVRDHTDSRALAGLSDALMQKYLRWAPDREIAARAEQVALQAIELDPSSPDAYKALGAFHHFLGHRERALVFYDQAVQRDSTYWMALNNGAELLRDAGQFDAARKWFHCALAASPRKLDVLIRLAGLEMRAGQAAEAKKYLQSAVMLDPKSDEAQSMLAELASGALPPAPSSISCEGDAGASHWCGLTRAELDCGSV